VRRQVFCTDALQWLDRQHNLEAIVTSFPELNELHIGPTAYIEFLQTIATKCFTAVKSSGYVVFLFTDRKHNGWIDKTYPLMHIAQSMKMKLLWHKIALRMDPGKSDLFRPTYSHMLCFSKHGNQGKPFPDVIFRGPITYSDAFGRDAVTAVLTFLQANGVKHVVDPFVGSGTTLAIANAMGMSATGVDIDPKQCALARKLKNV
jgi:hypothetical protein